MQYRVPHRKDATWNSHERPFDRDKSLKPHLGENQIGAEIGAYSGDFSEFLLARSPELYLVDSWYRGGPFWHSGIENDSRADTIVNLLTVCKEEIERGPVELVADYSKSFLQSDSDGYFNFIYIDASSKLDDSLAELRLSRSKVTQGRHLFGDDYNPKSKPQQN